MSCKTTRECVEGTGTCTCKHGYQGENCDIRPDPCYGNLCKNGATCIPGANDTYKCVCSQQYTGKYCEVSFDCLNFKLQSDVVLSCDGNLSTLICNVTCKPGKFRADLYHTETQFECGTASGNAWQISGTKTKIADFEFPMCSEVVPPVTMTVEMEALVPNLRCNELVLSSCNDNACKINQTSNCTEVGSSVNLVHKLSANLDCRNLELPVYFRNENVSDCLNELVQSYISMEQMIEEMKTIYVKKTVRRRRSRVQTSKYTTTKKEKTGLLMKRKIVRRSFIVQSFSCCWLPISYYPICPSGSVIHGGMCVYCPVGSYKKDQYKCEYCAAGYYQDKTGQSECTTCPVGYISPVGSTTLLDCEDFFQRNKESEDEASGDNTVEIISAVFSGLVGLILAILTIISYINGECVIRCKKS